MKDLVHKFNNLSRSRTVPSGLNNHWVFKVHHVPLEPPGDLLVAVHPLSYLQLTKGPAQVLSLPKLSQKAEVTVPLLLQAFIDGMTDSSGRQVEPWAPWTWSTDNPEFATAMEASLRLQGVKEDLCHVGVCSSEEKEVVEEVWSGLLGRLIESVSEDAKMEKRQAEVQPRDSTQCHSCGKTSGTIAGSLKNCSACKKAWYCSTDCQKQHWKRHKPTCLANRLDAFKYFNTIAHTVAKAQTLAKSVNLILPGLNGESCGTM
jgi:hypothetical protein